MRRGFTLVEIMIVVTIIALLVAIAIPALLRSKMTANESVARATLKTISTALETYAAANSWTYPTDETALIDTTPPYLRRLYCTQTISGYTYGCTLNPTDYIITARPLDCTTTGTKSFTIITGGALSTDATCTAADE